MVHSLLLVRDEEVKNVIESVLMMGCDRERVVRDYRAAECCFDFVWAG